MLTGFQHPIYIATTPVDMRKSFDSLSAIVKNSFKKNPLDGTFFVFINHPAEWGKRFLSIYKNLYKIEKEIKDEMLVERHYRRQNDSVLRLDEFFDLCRECASDATILPKSRLGQAYAYALSNEAALRRYCTDGRLAIDNNVSERTLHEFVVGRKNWLFFGSPEAARRSAMVMTVLSSARRHGVNEWEYLVDVLYRLSDLSSWDSISELLPDRWKKSPTPPTETAALVAARIQGNTGFTSTESLKPLSAKNRKI